VGPATSSPRSEDPANSSEDPDVDSAEDPRVEVVEPAQVTSPAVTPTDDSASSSQLDGKDGLSGTSSRSGSSNE